MKFKQVTLCCFIYIISFALLIQGCSNPIDVEYLLAGTNECRPPCWMGIYPGATTIDDAVDKLKALELEGDGKYYLSDEGIISWTENNLASTYIYIDENRLVAKIRIDARGNSIKINEVLKIFGDPSNLDIGKGGKDYFSVTLFYPTKGLVFVFSGYKIESKDSKTLYKIDPDMVLTFSYFLSPSDIETMVASLYGKNIVSNTLLQIQDWDGFGNYSE